MDIHILFDPIIQNNYDEFLVALDKFEDVDVRDNLNQTPLMAAAYHNRKEMVEGLLLKGANPNLYSDDGYNALINVINNKYWHSDDHDIIIRLLIKAGASPYVKNNKGNNTFYYIDTMFEKMQVKSYYMELNSSKEYPKFKVILNTVD